MDIRLCTEDSKFAIQVGKKKEKGERGKGKGRREKGEGRREKGEGRRKKEDGRRETGEGNLIFSNRKQNWELLPILEPSKGWKRW